MKVILSGLILLFVFSSCEEKEMEVKDISEILPSSERDYSKESAEELATSEDSSNYFMQLFLANGILIDGLERISDDEFPDRFNPKLSDKFKLKLYDDSVFYERWVYQDSSSLLSAFFNWMDCFGDDCTSLKPGDNVSLGKEPMQMFVNDTTLILITGDADMNRWMKYHSTLGYKMDWRYVMEQSRFGKAKWFKYSQEERIPIQPIQSLDNENSK